MKEVSKSELAKIIGKSGATVTNLVQARVLDNCFTPTGKIYLEKAINAITISKGGDFVKRNEEPEATEKKQLQKTQFEILEEVEKEKSITFKKDENIEKLKDRLFYLIVPHVETNIADVHKHLKNDFTDDQISGAIKEIDNEGRSNFLYEFLYELMKDTEEKINIQLIYKKMLSTFYSPSEIAFYMDCMKDD